MTRTTNFFGDLTETMYDNFEKNAAAVVDSIHKELVNSSPVWSGALRGNWKKGIRPNSSIGNKRDRNDNWLSVVGKFAAPSVEKVKTYGTHQRYYVWNNTPYLDYVNAGINPLRPKSANSKGFIGKAIAKGVAKASTFSKIQEMSFF